MIGRIFTLAFTGFLQLVRTRVYINILVAGIGLVLAALAFDQLTAGAGGRVLFNVGLAFIALVVAALSGVVAITGLARELESKQAHLVLARPVGRGEFMVARFLTTAMLTVLANLILGAMLAGLLLATGAGNTALAIGATVFASFEGFIVAAIALFFGVGSSSTMSAVFTTTLFILGRLSGEFFDLIERGYFGGAAPFANVVYKVLPHLPVFDLTHLAYQPSSATAILQAAAYGAAYTAAWMGAAILRFTRRDLL